MCPGGWRCHVSSDYLQGWMSLLIVEIYRIFHHSQPDSSYVKQGITKCHVTYETLWRELDSAIARQESVVCTWVKAPSGILLKECADQLATRAVNGGSCGPAIVTPDDEAVSEKEF
jgi:ribonuclease HI